MGHCTLPLSTWCCFGFWLSTPCVCTTLHTHLRTSMFIISSPNHLSFHRARKAITVKEHLRAVGVDPATHAALLKDIGTALVGLSIPLDPTRLQPNRSHQPRCPSLHAPVSQPGFPVDVLVSQSVSPSARLTAGIPRGRSRSHRLSTRITTRYRLHIHTHTCAHAYAVPPGQRRAVSLFSLFSLFSLSRSLSPWYRPSYIYRTWCMAT